MERFTALCEELEGTTHAQAKVEALADYLRAVPAEDAAWAIFFLTGRRIRRTLAGATLLGWAARCAELPAWLVARAHVAVGDAAETAALLVDAGARRHEVQPLPLHRWVEGRILPLQALGSEARYREVCVFWEELPRAQALVLNKLLCGGFSAGVSKDLVVRALAGRSGVPPALIQRRLAAPWRPGAAAWSALSAPPDAGEARLRPYRFLIPAVLDREAGSLGDVSEWVAEWAWPGVRAQLLRRGGEVLLWSQGEELITERYPEIARAAAHLPDGLVLDGKLLAWGGAGALPLVAREAQERPTQRSRGEAGLRFMAFDALELAGLDLRAWPLFERRARLEALLQDAHGLELSPFLQAASWAELEALRATARTRGCKGLILKRRDAAYAPGDEWGAWWAWEVAPFTIDAVLLYAQAPDGRPSNLVSEYTFALWDDGDLVPVAKAAGGLGEREARDLDRWIRRHTRERFGPVRSLAPVKVFTLAFDGVSASSRHKAGLVLDAPRIVRPRPDVPAPEAGSLDDLRRLLADRAG